MSRRIDIYVSTRNVIVPGNARKYGVMPYASTGKTGTPRGSAASPASRSAKMLSTLKLRYACCSVLPSGNTARSSRFRYSSTIIQFISLIRISQVDLQISLLHADLWDNAFNQPIDIVAVECL